jgi:hypothetical protein
MKQRGNESYLGKTEATGALISGSHEFAAFHHNLGTVQNLQVSNRGSDITLRA